MNGYKGNKHNKWGKKLCKCNIEPYMKQKDEKKMNLKKSITPWQ